MCAPSPVIADWWRGRSDVRESLLAAIYVDPISEAVARLAGEAISLVRGATAIDAIVVMASAAARGSLVYTSDVEDLTRLQRFFPGVRVLGV